MHKAYIFFKKRMQIYQQYKSFFFLIWTSINIYVWFIIHYCHKIYHVHWTSIYSIKNMLLCNLVIIVNVPDCSCAREICSIENSKFLTKTFDDLRPIINKCKDYWEIFVLFSECFSQLDISLFSEFLLNDYKRLK